MNLSIIVPCYNEVDVVETFYQEFVNEVCKMNIDFELIYIDDGSTDKTLAKIKWLAERDDRIRYISFSRNFGKEAAMLAGLEKAQGDIVGVMDVDLQDPIDLLPQMYSELQNSDIDCTAAQRINRKGENFFRSIASNMFYKIMKNIFNINVVAGVRDFRLMKRKMVDAILQLPERNRFSKGLFTWVGFNYKYFKYENRQRVAGETKWSFLQLFMYSLDGIMSFSNMPMHWVAGFGFVFFLVSVFMMLFVLIRTLIFGDAAQGWTSLVCIVFFLSSIQLLSLGMLGSYIAKIYTETKQRPLYIIRESK